MKYYWVIPLSDSNWKAVERKQGVRPQCYPVFSNYWDAFRLERKLCAAHLWSCADYRQVYNQMNYRHSLPERWRHFRDKWLVMIDLMN